MLAGCATRSPLPTYQWSSEDEALTILRQRADSVKTIQAACNITLIDAAGQSVTLDGALVARNPGWLRMRAWKFNTAVFDLTLTPDGVWVMQGDSPEVRQRMPVEFNAAQMAKAWTMLSGHMFNQGTLIRGQHGGDQVVVWWPNETGATLWCIVDRDTLVPREFVTFKDDAPHIQRGIELSDYRLIDGIAWPHALHMISDSARVQIRMHDVMLNQEPVSSTFIPPARAVKQP